VLLDDFHCVADVVEVGMRTQQYVDFLDFLFRLWTLRIVHNPWIDNDDFAGWGLKAECGVAQPRKFDAFKIHDLTVQLPFCRSPFIASIRPPPVEQVPAAAVVSPVASCGVLTG
jgi:hypothetical protein